MQGERPQPPVLPPGFVAQWSNQYSRYFYVNTATGQPQWDLPASQFIPPGPPPLGDRQGGSYLGVPPQQQQYPQVATPNIAPGQMRPIGGQQPMYQQQQQPVIIQQGAPQKQGISPALAAGGGAVAGLAVGAVGAMAVSGMMNNHNHHDYYNGYSGYNGGF
ncbi:UNVERIFIED_CONTAM: hypothetical protein HDU68_003807 [Siphonaria sp. JEL0065]|nr:hypothetical protein HDU68_003807 [Siphonaria sp. JEL0065]